MWTGRPYLAAFFLQCWPTALGWTPSKDLHRARNSIPIQEAFIEASAFQCGFCTSGFIMMVKQLLNECPNPSEDYIRHYLTGNLCRCSAYPEIINAVKLAAARREQASRKT